MKFTFEKDAMIKEISIAQEIISTKNAGSMLSNVLLIAENNTLTIKATDIKVNFQTQIPVNIDIEGTTTVYCDKFMGILQSLPEGDVEFIQEESPDNEKSITVTIKPVLKKIKFQMKSMSEEKFPEFDSAEKVPYFEIPSKELKEMILHTAFAVSVDETRYFMNGVYFEKKDDSLNLIATDGRRLSFASKNILAGVSDFTPAIVHPKILNIILKHAPVEGNIFMAIVDKMIFFKFGSYSFGSVLIDGQFPNYSRVIPDHQDFVFKVQKDELMGAFKRVALMVDKKSGRIYFDISDGVLKISSQQADLGSSSEEIPCEYSGEPAVIALNYRYIDEPLRGMDCERIAFEFTAEMKAITMRPEPAEDYFDIIMPMQKE